MAARDETDALVVRVPDIPPEGRVFEAELPREWLDNIPEFSDDEGAHVEGSIRVRGRLIADGASLRLKGKVELELVTYCVRCGARIRCPLSGELERVLLKGPPPDLPEDLELSESELDQAYYESEDVDLAPFFKEQAALDTPLQPLCKEDCEGLCHVCGADLNVESCTCEREDGHPGLAVLRDLKIEDE